MSTTAVESNDHSELERLLEKRRKNKERAKQGAAVWFATFSFLTLAFYAGVESTGVFDALIGVGTLAWIYMTANLAEARGYHLATGILAGLLSLIGLLIILLIPNQMEKKIKAERAKGMVASESAPSG